MRSRICLQTLHIPMILPSLFPPKEVGPSPWSLRSSDEYLPKEFHLEDNRLDKFFYLDFCWILSFVLDLSLFH